MQGLGVNPEPRCSIPCLSSPLIIPCMQSPCDEGWRPSALIMSHLISFGKSLAEGPSITLDRQCHPQLCHRDQWEHGKLSNPALARAHGAQGGDSVSVLCH